MDRLLQFVQHDLHIIALVWMGIMYASRAYQFARLPWPWDKAPFKGSAAAGVLSSYALLFLPWSMVSTRKRPWLWLEFAVYHLGLAAAISVTFTMPFAPGLLTMTVRQALAGITALAAAIGVLKLVRRISLIELRVISTPDDYFSLVAGESFLVAASVVLVADSPMSRLVFFSITAGYLFYVPLSKVSHYVYYFLAALVTGARYGLRAVRPGARR